MVPWNSWVHVTGSTYGQWLRGDPRGWRAWKHWEHCEGDYRHRPDPEEHADKLERSRCLMKRDAVYLCPRSRDVAAAVMLAALQHHKVDVAALCVGETHYHVLARFFSAAGKGCRLPRRLMGVAKKEAARALSREGLAEPGGVFAGGCGRRWIKDRRHQVTVVHYILRHAREGASTWALTGGRTLDPDRVQSSLKRRDCSPSARVFIPIN